MKSLRGLFLFIAEEWKMLFWNVMFSSFYNKHWFQVNMCYQSFHENVEEKKEDGVIWIVKIIRNWSFDLHWKLSEQYGF